MEQYEDWDDSSLNMKDFNYAYAAIEVQNSLKAEWGKVKRRLPKDDAELLKAVENFEKCLNYFYEV